MAAIDSGVADALRAREVELTEARGEFVGANIKNHKGLSAEDYARLRQLPHLKMLGTGQGFDDAALKALEGLKEVEGFSTNGMAVTDAGLASLRTFKELRRIALFHPGKQFTGKGFASFEESEKLESLTVAGSAEFADDGMDAVCKLTNLREFRMWHTGVSNAGMQKLGGLKGLKALTLGQCLSNTKPPALTNDTLVVIAGLSKLESLTLQEARLSLSSLLQLKALSSLKKLNLDGIEITEADVAELRKQLPHTEVKWSAPTEAFSKRIRALFGEK